MRDLISGEAELDSEEDDESFNGEDGEDGEERPRKREGRVEDSSDDEEDDDDEEEARRVRALSSTCFFQQGINTNNSHRSAKASLSTKMRMRKTMMMRANLTQKSDHNLSARGNIATGKKKRASTRTISTLSASNSESDQNPRPR